MSTPAASFVGIPERLRLGTEQWRQLLWQFSCELRVAIPGIVQSFNPTLQTVTVQVAVRERMLNAQASPINPTLYVLTDVPIVMPSAGIFSLTLPVQAGDECLLIFADCSISQWWQSGEVSDQIDKRRHSLSDGFAIIGPWSKANRITNYSPNTAQLRTDDSTVVIELTPTAINITAPQINILSTGGTTMIDGKPFLTHEHSGVTSGGSVSGPVV